MCLALWPTFPAPLPSRPSSAQNHKDHSQKAIPPESWGVLLTCQGDRGKRAVDEARLLFEEAFERMGKSHILAGGGGAANAADADDDANGAAASAGEAPKSVEAMLAAEVADLKDKKKAAPFRWHDTGVNNTIFVNFPKCDGEWHVCSLFWWRT